MITLINKCSLTASDLSALAWRDQKIGGSCIEYDIKVLRGRPERDGTKVLSL